VSVNLAFDVDVQAGPGFAVDEVDEAAQLGGVLDFVLGLAEDDGDEAGADAERIQDVAVVALQGVAVQPQQALPVEIGGDGAAPAEQAGLVIHLEEEQVGELLQVVAVRNAVVAEDVAVVPDALDDGGGSGHGGEIGTGVNGSLRGNGSTDKALSTRRTLQ
jgi:hypothetical protein